MPQETAAATLIAVRIPLTPDLVDHFEAQAVLAGTDLESAIAAHITRTAAYSADRNPIYLNDAEATEVRRLLGGRVNSGSKLVDMISRLCSWKVGGYKVEIPPAVQEQIFEYARAIGKPMEKIAPELIINAIREKFRT